MVTKLYVFKSNETFQASEYRGIHAANIPRSALAAVFFLVFLAIVLSSVVIVTDVENLPYF